jgi:O-antigen ligase
MLNQQMKAIVWLSILKIVGSLGLMLGLIAFVKSIMDGISSHVNIKKYIWLHILPISLFMMLLWSFLSALNSNNFLFSFYGSPFRQEGLATYFTYAGIFTCGYIIKQNGYTIKCMQILVGTASLLSLLAILNIHRLNLWFHIEVYSSIFSNANHFAYYLCLALMCSLFLVLQRQRFSTGLLVNLICFVLISAALVRNRSFGPYLAVIFGFACCFALLLKYARKKIALLLTSFTLFIITSVVVNLFQESLLSDFVKLWFDSKSILSGAQEAPNAGSYRWLLWTNGLKFIEQRPLFGFGPDNLGAKYAELGIVFDRPHNELIQFAASLGLPALFFYVTALVTHFITMIQRKWLTTLVGICFFCAIITYLCSSMVGNTMYYTTPFFFFVLGLSGGLLSRFYKVSS